MAKQKCRRCGSILAAKESPSTCQRCDRLVELGLAALASRSTSSPSLHTYHDDLLERMRDRPDGWLRVVPQVSGDFSFKYRYTAGRWAGHYIFYVVPMLRPPSFGFRGIHDALNLVDAEQLKPSLDVWK